MPGGADIKATAQLKLSPDGAPIHYEWSAQLQKKATGKVDFVNGTAKCSIDLGSATPMIKEFTFTSPRVAVLDNNLYYQYDVLAQVYDWKAGGKQTFPVLIPQDMVPGSISVESMGPRQVENATYESLRVNSTDLEILVYVDNEPPAWSASKCLPRKSPSSASRKATVRLQKLPPKTRFPHYWNRPRSRRRKGSGQPVRWNQYKQSLEPE